jgi:hypothetical protein
MSKYNFGDTFIKNNRVYIVVGEEGKRKDKFYYVQTRSGKLLTRSEKGLDDLVEKLNYEYQPSLCDPKFITARDLKIGDMIVGRCKSPTGYGYIAKKRAGIVVGKSGSKNWSGKNDRIIKIMWADTGQVEKLFFNYVLFRKFNKCIGNAVWNKFRWKHVPVVK